MKKDGIFSIFWWFKNVCVNKHLPSKMSTYHPLKAVTQTFWSFEWPPLLYIFQSKRLHDTKKAWVPSGFFPIFFMVQGIQVAQLILGRFAFYAMNLGYFELLKMTIKVILLPRASGSKQIWMRSFKWGTVCSCRSNGCKVASLQSLQSKKCWDILGSRLQFSQVYVVNRCSSGGPGSIPGHCKLWGPTILKSLSQ